VLARTYGARATGVARDGQIPFGDRDLRAATTAVDLITQAAQALPRNPNETLLVQSLFVRLAALTAS
jgi:hypothetical protein